MKDVLQSYMREDPSNSCATLFLMVCQLILSIGWHCCSLSVGFNDNSFSHGFLPDTFSWADRKKVAIDVAIMLAAFHDKGLVHGGVNSKNIMVDKVVLLYLFFSYSAKALARWQVLS